MVVLLVVLPLLTNVAAAKIVPKQYVCYRTAGPIAIDGRLNEPSWKRAAWTDLFVDIEGDVQPRPRFGTRAMMVWDDEYFYVAADMEETDVWGTLTKRDTVIYYDNDFEVFIDPNGDTLEYYEFEMNALNTMWDLFLNKPYNKGGRANTAWNLTGLRHAVQIYGTLNWPEDVDQGWSLEIAFPWTSLAECAGDRSCPPKTGDFWRVNFSRVEHKKGVKKEDNWVWSPQGVINMHVPEMWGYVYFSKIIVGTGEEAFGE